MENKRSLMLILAVISTFFWGYQTRAGTKALFGGIAEAGLGGDLGALIGRASRVISTGMITGTILDKNDQEYLREQSPETYQRLESGESLSVYDIMNLSKARISDDQIINLIKKTNSHYTLNRYQMDRMRDAGVSEKVIYHMMYET